MTVRADGVLDVDLPPDLALGESDEVHAVGMTADATIIAGTVKLYHRAVNHRRHPVSGHFVQERAVTADAVAVVVIRLRIVNPDETEIDVLGWQGHLVNLRGLARRPVASAGTTREPKQ